MHYRPALDKYSAPVSTPVLMKSHLRLILLSLVVIALLPSLSLAQQGTLTDDAQISTSHPNKNFGSDQSLQVTNAEKSLIKFKLTPNLPPGTVGSHIGKATLKVFLSDVKTPGQFEIHRVLGAWAEQSITSGTAPTLGVAEATLAVTADQAGKWVTIDVTQMVKDWLDGALPNNGVALMSPGAIDVTFDSKENTNTSHEPRLEIVLNHAATADQATTADTANTISGVLPTNKG